MEWPLFWTIISQIVLSLLILGFPVSIILFLCASAIKTGSQSGKDKLSSQGNRIGR
jgi:hypothetical protein